ncbi:MAG: hypothetical protein EB075_15505, partial [Bacteroidetes bacterium]|nr:hypothetical protein [Bacteroidota bacterium]
MINNIVTYPNQIDTAELSQIKSNFRLRDRSNADRYEELKKERSNPQVLFDRLATPESLERNTLRGLSYPLALDSNGGLKVTYGIERIGQAIQEVFETRIGERIGSP